MTAKPSVNLFYVLLVLAGVAFAISACGYGVMMVHKIRQPYATPPPLIQWLDAHGFRLLMIELAVLAVATLAAMVSDKSG